MTSTNAPSTRRLIELGRRLNDAQYELVIAAAAFASGDEWRDHAPAAAHWIADHLDVHLGTAREWIRIGTSLTELPSIDDAFGQGRLSYSKVRVLSRVATPDNERELLEIAETVPASQLAAELAQWSNRHEDPVEREARHRRHRRLTTWIDPDGMVSGFFRLPPGQGGLVMAAIRAMVRRRAVRRGEVPGAQDAPAGAPTWPTLPQQRADALVECITGGDAQLSTEIVLHVRGDGCSFDDGTPLPMTTVERFAPDAFFRALIHDTEGRPVNVSRRRRHPDARQRRLVKERDRVCVDCGSTELLEYDHVPDHSSTGHTTPDELQLRCAPCHHRRHGRAA